MNTYTALTTLPGETAANALGEAMETLTPAPTAVGISRVEDGSGLWEVAGYFIEVPDPAGLALLVVIHSAQPFSVTEIEGRDWVAQVRRELAPVHAGRFVVYGGHDALTIAQNKIGLEIEAAQAFGTGHHGTTQGCLLAFDALLNKGLMARNVADIGSGTGVLAMAAARSGARRVLASDIDQVATDTARANVLANRLAGAIQCVTAVGFRQNLITSRAPFDLIFANILAGPLKKLAPDMARHTGNGSILILSGILNTQSRGVENVYKGWGFSRLDIRVIGDWTTLTLQKF